MFAIWTLMVGLGVLCASAEAQEHLVCRMCDCNRDLRIIRCAGAGLRYLPDLTWANPAVYHNLDLRGNELTFVDFKKIVKFRIVNLQNNPLSCEHGLLNTNFITLHNVIYIDCEIPGVRSFRTPQTTDFGDYTTSQPNNDDDAGTSILEKTDTAIVGMGAFGEAEAYTKGKLELAWGISTSLTICGIIGGLVTCLTLNKILQRIRVLDGRIKSQHDFEAPRPNTPPRSLFEDLSNAASSTLGGFRNSANRNRSEDTPPKPSTSGVIFECYGGSDTEGEEDLENVPVRQSTNPFQPSFSPHEVCGLSDTFASFTLNGYRQQHQGFVTDDDEDFK